MSFKEIRQGRIKTVIEVIREGLKMEREIGRNLKLITNARDTLRVFIPAIRDIKFANFKNYKFKGFTPLSEPIKLSFG